LSLAAAENNESFKRIEAAPAAPKACTCRENSLSLAAAENNESFKRIEAAPAEITP
jgi:hypothetical protein